MAAKATRAPKPKKPRLGSAEHHANAIKAAKTRFNRPKFVAALNDYAHTAEARQRSSYLDSLIRKSR